MCTHSCLFSTFFPLGYATAAQFLPTRGSSSSATRTTRTSRCFISQSTSLWRPASASESFYRILYFASAVSDIYVIIVINNIRIRFIMTFYVICAMIYCSFCCIYVWLDPGTYMIVRFMSFYKPGVTDLHMRKRKDAKRKNLPYKPLRLFPSGGFYTLPTRSTSVACPYSMDRCLRCLLACGASRPLALP